MDRTGFVLSKRRGPKGKDGVRSYIIRYRYYSGEHEIRLKEKVDTDVSFYPGNQIRIQTHDDLIIVTNHTIPGRVEGTKV